MDITKWTVNNVPMTSISKFYSTPHLSLSFEKDRFFMAIFLLVKFDFRMGITF